MEPDPTRSNPLDGRVLVIDDDEPLCDAIGHVLRAAGCDVQTTTDPTEGLARLQSFAPDVLVSDVKMAGVDGFEVLAHAHRHDPFLGIVLMSGFALVPDAVRAMREGAEHYVAKPVRAFELLDAVRRVRERQRSRAHLRLHRGLEEVPAPHGLELIGTHPLTVELIREAAEIAGTDRPVLLVSEQGADQGGVARAIHTMSARAARSFCRIDCAALTEDLLEAELFGGHTPARLGKINIAEGGTLFLDELRQLSPGMQARLDRLIAERRYERRGHREQFRADVRIIIATEAHAAPRWLSVGTTAAPAAEGGLAQIVIPPLSSRKSDIPVLVEYAVAEAARQLGTRPPAVTPEAMQALSRYQWPGNVRELQNILGRLVSLAPAVPITAAAVWPSLERRSAPAGQVPAIPGASFDAIERHAILVTYEGCGRNVLRTARILGISPRAVHYRLREYRGETGRRANSVPDAAKSAAGGRK